MNISTGKQKIRVLVAPLDWGLGHSTRCIPMIKELISQGCEVYIVADKKTFSLLKKEFPATVFLRYKGYEIEYSQHTRFFALKLLSQFPQVLLTVFRENKWLKRTVKQHSIDVVISDNRFGMYHKNIPSVYITHQLYIKTGNKFIEQLAQIVHYYFIKKFRYCFIPDTEENGLAGELSHPKHLPPNAIYIGPVSRFFHIAETQQIYDLCIILSGPEPQRSIFEDELLDELKDLNEKVFLVRGLPANNNTLQDFNNVRIENHLEAAALNKVVEQSKIVICRSGYTSVMDLAALQKKAVLIPTPGQTEQEYLGRFLMQKEFFLCEKQKGFSISKALKHAATFPYKLMNFEKGEYKTVLKKLVDELKSGKIGTISRIRQ